MMRTGSAIRDPVYGARDGPFSRKKRPDVDEIPPEAAAIVEQLTEMFPEATVTVNEPVEVASTVA